MDAITAQMYRLRKTDFGEGGWFKYLKAVDKLLRLAGYSCTARLTYTHPTLRTWKYIDGLGFRPLDRNNFPIPVWNW